MALPKALHQIDVSEVVGFATNMDEATLPRNVATECRGVKFGRPGMLAERDWGTIHRFPNYPASPSAIRIIDGYTLFDQDEDREYEVVVGLDTSNNMRIYVNDPDNLQPGDVDNDWIELTRQIRARVNVSQPSGTTINIDTITDDLNVTHTLLVNELADWIGINQTNKSACYVVSNTASQITIKNDAGNNLGWNDNENIRFYRCVGVAHNYVYDNGNFPHLRWLGQQARNKVTLFYGTSANPPVMRNSLAIYLNSDFGWYIDQAQLIPDFAQLATAENPQRTNGTLTDGTSAPLPRTIAIGEGIEIELTSATETADTDTNKTSLTRMFVTLLYDDYQESDPIYQAFISPLTAGRFPQPVFTMRMDYARFNKRITGWRWYWARRYLEDLPADANRQKQWVGGMMANIIGQVGGMVAKSQQLPDFDAASEYILAAEIPLSSDGWSDDATELHTKEYAFGGTGGTGRGIGKVNTPFMFMPNYSAISFDNGNNFSIEFWCRVGDGADAGGLVHMANFNLTEGILAGWEIVVGQAGSRRVDILMRDGISGNTGARNVNWNALLIADGWTHIVITINTTTGTIVGYSDGSSVGANGDTGSLQGNNLLFRKPTLYCGSNSVFEVAGVTNYGLDQLRIWNVVLTSGNVTTLYNSGNGIADAERDTSIAGLVLEIPFDDVVGTLEASIGGTTSRGQKTKNTATLGQGMNGSLHFTTPVTVGAIAVANANPFLFNDMKEIALTETRNLLDQLAHSPDLTREYFFPRFAAKASRSQGAIVVVDQDDRTLRLSTINGSGVHMDDVFPDRITDLHGNLQTIFMNGQGKILGIEIVRDDILVFREGELEFVDLFTGQVKVVPADCVATKSITACPQGIVYGGKSGIYLVPSGGGDFRVLNLDWLNFYDGRKLTNDDATPFITDQMRRAAIAYYDPLAREVVYQLPVNLATPTRQAITAASNADPIVITSASHGRSNGDIVTIEEVLGNTAANGTWEIANQATNTYELVRSEGNAAYTSGGIATSSEYLNFRYNFERKVWWIRKFNITSPDVRYFSKSKDGTLTIGFEDGILQYPIIRIPGAGAAHLYEEEVTSAGASATRGIETQLRLNLGAIYSLREQASLFNLIIDHDMASANAADTYDINLFANGESSAFDTKTSQRAPNRNPRTIDPRGPVSRAEIEMQISSADRVDFNRWNIRTLSVGYVPVKRIGNN